METGGAMIVAAAAPLPTIEEAGADPGQCSSSSLSSSLS